MTKYVKKKFNVKVFILLLFCAFVPGIIYAIYKSIPVKITDEEPKRNGFLLRVIGSGVFILGWVILCITISIIDDEVPLTFIIFACLGVIMLILALLSKTYKKIYLYLNLILNICGFILCCIYIYYGFIAIFGTILNIIGFAYGNKYAAYAYGKRHQEAFCENEERPIEEINE